jgi:hypothetical protein
MAYPLRYGEPDWDSPPVATVPQPGAHHHGCDIQQRILSRKCYEELRLEALNKQWVVKFVDLNQDAVSSGADASFVKLKNLVDVVEVVVGEKDEAARYVIHEKLIVDDSEFADHALNGPFKEKDERKILLPEEDPDIFAEYVRFLYTGCVITFSLERVVQMYTLGDRLQSTKFANACYETISKSTDTWAASRIKYIFENTFQEDRLRKLCTKQVGKGILQGRYSFSLDHEQEMLRDFMPELMKGVTEAVAELKASGDKWYPPAPHTPSNPFESLQPPRRSIFDPPGDHAPPTSSAGGRPVMSFGPGTGTARPFGAPVHSSGLFGPPPSQATGGLFGQPTQSTTAGFGTQPSHTTGGLFGTQPAQSSGGLFGTQTTQPSGGLFGTQTARPTGGLFGSTQPTGTLFGNAQPTGTLFGNAQSTGTLFGAHNTQPTSGGFSTTSMAPPYNFPSSQGGGLFGTQTAQNAGGSLFGTQRPPAGPGLFSAFGASGGTSQAGNSSYGSNYQGPTVQPIHPASTGRTSLFGNASAASSTPQPTGLFGSAQSANSGGLFGANSSSTMSSSANPGFSFGPSPFAPPSASVSSNPSAPSTGFGSVAPQQPNTTSNSTSPFSFTTQAPMSNASPFCTHLDSQLHSNTRVPHHTTEEPHSTSNDPGNTTASANESQIAHTTPPFTFKATSFFPSIGRAGEDPSSQYVPTAPAFTFVSPGNAGNAAEPNGSGGTAAAEGTEDSVEHVSKKLFNMAFPNASNLPDPVTTEASQGASNTNDGPRGGVSFKQEEWDSASFKTARADGTEVGGKDEGKEGIENGEEGAENGSGGASEGTTEDGMGTATTTTAGADALEGAKETLKGFGARIL